jgi:hypothetical protein
MKQIMASPIIESIDLKTTATRHENCGHGVNYLRPTTLAEVDLELRSDYVISDQKIIM